MTRDEGIHAIICLQKTFGRVVALEAGEKTWDDMPDTEREETIAAHRALRGTACK
jgi:hypothetical protein